MSQVNLFRIQQAKEESFIKFLGDQYEMVSSSQEHGVAFKLFYQHSANEQEVNWGWAFSLFDEPVRKTAAMPKGVLLVRRAGDGSRLYAVSFGGAHFHVDQHADRDFGFDFACRVSVKKMRLTATVNNNSKKNKTISSYREFDHLEINSGESYTKLKIVIDQGCASEIIDDGIEVGTSLKVNLKDASFENIARLVDYVEQVIKEPRKNQIPFFTLVTKHEEIELLDSKLKQDFLDEESTITISEFDVVGTDEVFNRADSYELCCGRECMTVSVLDWPILRKFFAERQIDNVDAMFSTRVRFLVNGNSLVSKPIRGLIDYLNEAEQALLVGGSWYRFNDDFVDCLHKSLSELSVVYEPKYDLTVQQMENIWERKYKEHRNEEKYAKLEEEGYQAAIRRRYYKEYAFNVMRLEDGYELGDRKLVTLNSGEKIEVYDLRKEDAIYSVKRGNGSAELSYLVTQSEVAVDSCVNRAVSQANKPKKVVLWMILPRVDRLPIKEGRLDWNKLGMLLLKIRIVTWMKKVRLSGMMPEIRINYEEPIRQV